MRVFALTLVALALAALLAAAPALAQETVVPVMKPAPLPAGQTVLSISATERLQVPQDLLVASLRIDKTGPNARTVQADVNALMKAALEKARAVAGLKISTGGYFVYEETPPVTPENLKPKKSWRASQNLEIKGANVEDILKLSGELQDMGLLMSNLGYMLSPEKMDEAKDSMLEAALAKLKARAERAAKALNKTSAELVEVNVEANDMVQSPRPMMYAMAKAASAEMAAPNAEPGETEIILTVSAKALLKP